MKLAGLFSFLLDVKPLASDLPTTWKKLITFCNESNYAIVEDDFNKLTAHAHTLLPNSFEEAAQLIRLSESNENCEVANKLLEILQQQASNLFKNYLKQLIEDLENALSHTLDSTENKNNIIIVKKISEYIRLTKCILDNPDFTNGNPLTAFAKITFSPPAELKALIDLHNELKNYSLDATYITEEHGNDKSYIKHYYQFHCVIAEYPEFFINYVFKTVTQNNSELNLNLRYHLAIEFIWPVINDLYIGISNELNAIINTEPLAATATPLLYARNSSLVQEEKILAEQIELINEINHQLDDLIKSKQAIINKYTLFIDLNNLLSTKYPSLCTLVVSLAPGDVTEKIDLKTMDGNIIELMAKLEIRMKQERLLAGAANNAQAISLQKVAALKALEEANSKQAELLAQQQLSALKISASKFFISSNNIEPLNVATRQHIVNTCKQKITQYIQNRNHKYAAYDFFATIGLFFTQCTNPKNSTDKMRRTTYLKKVQQALDKYIETGDVTNTFAHLNNHNFVSRTHDKTNANYTHTIAHLISDIKNEISVDKLDDDKFVPSVKL